MTSLTFFQFTAILEQSPDSGRIVCKIYIFMNSNLLFYKNWLELRNLQHSSRTIALSKGTILAKKTLIFWQRMLASAKLRGSWY